MNAARNGGLELFVGRDRACAEKLPVVRARKKTIVDAKKMR